ncbi:toll/interleukin-1 receptor domain-containing protein [Streptomyces sp. 796.1]|uniref:toll/interleukin-1 receptor domain-containing protein n=1 Tax=Streptomyces sp. 796.1 TaxID=3163029 RepID=UPI0039C90DF2
MALVFLNYRRQGGAYAAALLDELLIGHFGQGQVFRAARSIAPGADYAEAILTAVAECEVMLAIIDEGWAAELGESSTSGGGDSWALREIEEALKHRRTVVPVLLSGVRSLAGDGSPGLLDEMSRRQYLRFDYRNVRQDSEFIAEQLTRASRKIRNARRGPDRCRNAIGRVAGFPRAKP